MKPTKTTWRSCLTQASSEGGERMENKGFWHWLAENHPVLYEVIQWGILALAILALIFG